MSAVAIASGRRSAALGFGRGVDSSLLRHLSSQVGKTNNKASLVYALALVRRLEAQGLPSKQAEAITATIAEVLNDSLENIIQSVLKPEMQRGEMMQDSNLSKLKSEMKSSQEHHLALFQKEMEKLRGDTEKLHSELRYEIDKVTAVHRLDLNLEKGHICDELAKQRAESSDLTHKTDRASTLTAIIQDLSDGSGNSLRLFGGQALRLQPPHLQKKKRKQL